MSDGEIPGWQDYGACIGHDPDIFFPVRGGVTKRAKDICDACPVEAECLDFALRNQEKFGVWGGTSERQRRRMRRELGISGPPRGGRPRTEEPPHLRLIEGEAS